MRNRKTSVKWASLDTQCATRGLWLMHSGCFLLCTHRMASLGRQRCAKFISNHFSINQKAKKFLRQEVKKFVVSGKGLAVSLCFEEILKEFMNFLGQQVTSIVLIYIYIYASSDIYIYKGSSPGELF